jgi:MFS transporter, SP family, arabinose:H+ symporter
MNKSYIIVTSIIVALGGFLFGFDTAVINGVNGPLIQYFDLNELQLGWSTSSLTLAATLSMMISGIISDRVGRKKILVIASVLFSISAIASALATEFWFFVIARMLGGFGVGAALLIAPMYIAEIAPPKLRGSLISFNQLNIVVGMVVAYFIGWLFNDIGENNWRWMLGIEAVPAIIYFFALFAVSESPRWLIMKERIEEGKTILIKSLGIDEGEKEYKDIIESFKLKVGEQKAKFFEVFKKRYRLVLLIAVVIAFFQQATGINAILYYAAIIFEQTGIGTNAALTSSIFVGVTNMVFTIVAILLIEKLGRKILLMIGLSGMAIFMFLAAFAFFSATYTINTESYQKMAGAGISATAIEKVKHYENITFNSYSEFKSMIKKETGTILKTKEQAAMISSAIKVNSLLVLIGILGFVGLFAMSIGPIIWVLIAELFPNKVRGVGVSFVGFVNSMVAFLVAFLFPTIIVNAGSANTYVLFGGLALIAFVFVLLKVPETKGKSLEEIEKALVK